MDRADWFWFILGMAMITMSFFAESAYLTAVFIVIGLCCGIFIKE